jgi:hypothetical protein
MNRSDSAPLGAMTKEIELKPSNCAQRLFFLVEEMVMEFAKAFHLDSAARNLYSYIARAHRFDPECCINVILCSNQPLILLDAKEFFLNYLTNLVGTELANKAYKNYSCLDHAQHMCVNDQQLAHWIKRYFGELTDDQPKPIFDTNPQPLGYEDICKAKREARDEYSLRVILEGWRERAQKESLPEHIKPKFCNSKISIRTREGGGMTIEETL